MPQRICILALVGLPAAGKSQFCRRLLRLNQSSFNILHLCYDDFLRLPADEGRGVAYKEQRSEILQTLQSLVQSLNANRTVPPALQCKMPYFTAASDDFLIICDDNNYYTSMRYKLYQFCRLHRLAYAQIYLDCPLAQSLAGNAQRPPAARVPDAIVEQMAARLEPPNAIQHPWQANTLTLTHTGDAELLSPTTDNVVVPFILQSFQRIAQTVEPAIASTPAAIQSFIHQLDLQLRQRIGELLSGEPAANKRGRANHLNAKRKAILRELREHSATLTLHAEDFNVYVNLLN